MRLKILIALLVLSVGVAGYTLYESNRLKNTNALNQSALTATRMFDVADSDRAQVDLDDLLQLRPRQGGTREIGPLAPITFEVVVKEAPKVISTGYLQEAFGILGYDPAPKVTHRMFVETAQGQVMPVYVWDKIAANFAAGPNPVQLRGFQVYTYSKGPAIVVDGAF